MGKEYADRGSLPANPWGGSLLGASCHRPRLPDRFYALVAQVGNTFRYDRDLWGQNKRYWNLLPSRKALLREQAVLRASVQPASAHFAYSPPKTISISVLRPPTSDLWFPLAGLSMSAFQHLSFCLNYP